MADNELSVMKFREGKKIMISKRVSSQVLYVSGIEEGRDVEIITREIYHRDYLKTKQTAHICGSLCRLMNRQVSVCARMRLLTCVTVNMRRVRTYE